MKKITALLFVLILCFAIVSCETDMIDPDAEVDTLEEEIEHLETTISAQYDLEDFELTRIEISIRDRKRKPFKLTIEGTCDGDGERNFWEKSFTVTPKDFNTLYSINEDMTVYSAEGDESSEESFTDIPAWAVEGVYNIIFKRKSMNR